MGIMNAPSMNGVEDARAALTAAEKESADCIEHETALAKIDAALTAHALEQVPARADRDGVFLRFRKALQANADAAEATCAALRTAEAEHIKALRVLAGHQEQLALAEQETLLRHAIAFRAPMGTGSMGGRAAAQDFTETVNAITTLTTARASAGSYHKTIAPYREMVRAGAELLTAGVRGMLAELTEVNQRAKEARAEGIDASDVDASHVPAAALLAIQEALPELLPTTRVCALITREILICRHDAFYDAQGATRQRASAHPLAWLLGLWSSTLLGAQREDTRERDTELAIAKIKAAMGEATEEGALGAVEAVRRTVESAPAPSGTTDPVYAQHVEAQESFARAAGRGRHGSN
jgi:hypothetical protein